MKNEVKHAFDKTAATWDENPVRVRLAADIAGAIKELSRPTREMDVMDFGCGTGLLSLQFQPLVHSITGVDTSEGMLDVFNSKITAMNIGNIQTRIIDLENGGQLPGNYDLILSSMTFHHIKDIEAILHIFYRSLNPGGSICIADLDLENGLFHSDNDGIFHFGFDRQVMEELFKKCGYCNIRTIDAAKVEKPGSDGIKRSFSVFAIQGKK